MLTPLLASPSSPTTRSNSGSTRGGAPSNAKLQETQREVDQVEKNSKQKQKKNGLCRPAARSPQQAARATAGLSAVYSLQSQSL